MPNTAEELVKELTAAGDRSLLVQRTSLLKVIRRDDVKGQVTVRRHDGTEEVRSWDQLCTDHFPINQGRYLKPKFQPTVALISDRFCEVTFGDQTILITAGMAILVKEGRPFSILSEDEFYRDFETVNEAALTETHIIVGTKP
jgi:hypothetical protein